MKRQARVLRLQGRMIRKHVLELEAQNLQLENLNQEKLQLIGLVSHDLKGPFNRIFALAQLLSMENVNLTEDQKEYIGKIHQISVDGLGMVRNLLDSRRLDEKGIVLNEAEMNLSTLVSSLIKHYRPIAEKKKIEIDSEITGAFIIKADKNYLSRVIENLISNSVKFSEENKKVTARLHQTNKGVEFSVKDEGPGISQSDQQKLFQRFQTLSAKPTGGETSTGLGLFISKTILEKMGAQIICESEEGVGATFTVILPQQLLN
ncbi:MAG: HAMP domain-containing sensor histidine kinase [Cyclobacteriaceae bacterium]